MQGIQRENITANFNDEIHQVTTTVSATNAKIVNVNVQPTNLTAINNYKITNTKKSCFNIEEQNLILHFKNNGSITELTYEQLIILSSLYQFTPDDLIKIQHNTDFFYYLNKTKIITFNNLPEEIKQDISFAKLAFDCEYYEFIAYIPKDQQTQEICDNAFYSLLENIEEYFYYLDDKFKTISMCELYLKYAKKIDFALIPAAMRNQLKDVFIQKIKNTEFNDVKLNDLRFQGIHLLPVSALLENHEIVAIACVSDIRAIKKFDTNVINNAVLQLLATKTIACIPKDKINIELILIRIKATTSLSKRELVIINSHIPENKSIIQNALLTSSSKKLKLLLSIDDSLTAEQCITYCDEYLDLYTKLPAIMQANSKVIKHILEKDFCNICIINKEYLTEEYCLEAYDNIPPPPLIINSAQDSINYKKNKHIFINNVPEEYRNLDMWFYLCTNIDRKYMHDIPSHLLTKKFLAKLISEYIKWNNRFDLVFIEDLFSKKLLDEKSENKILNHTTFCCARFSTALFSILKSIKIPKEFKNKLWVNLKNGNLQSSKNLIVAELYSKTSPLKQEVPVTVVTDFLASCYKLTNANKEASISATAQALKNYLNKKLDHLPLDQTSNNFFRAKVTGGRTIQVNTSKTTAVFYKFRKKDEPLNDFIKEGYFLEFLHTTYDGKRLRNELLSDIPILQKMVSIPIYVLPTCTVSCEDDFDVYMNNDNVLAVDVLIFSGSQDYLKYAHKTDDNNQEKPFLKSENGLLKACHDIGVFMSHGIYHTSILPAFHYAKNNRSWIALHMMLRQLYDSPVREFPIERTDFSMVGKLENWDTTATARPDYGWTGIRDLADCEFYGEIFSTLTRTDCKGLKLFQGVMQNILATNATCECLLAAILLYARLHKSENSYHYKNKTQHKKTAAFIEELFTTFLKARIQDETISLQEFMQLTKDDYAKWLDRATTELLYWTAKQNLDKSNKYDNTNNPRHYLYDCFANHVNQGELPEKLFDDNIVSYYIEYPESFTDNGNETSNHLGSYNATLPLLALLNFMILLNTRLNEHGKY